MKFLLNRWLLAAAAVAIVSAVAAIGGSALAGKHPSKSANGLGQLSGLLPRDHLTVESAIQVDLSREPCACRCTRAGRTARRSGSCCSTPPTPGIAHDLGVNFAPKLGNIGIGCPECVQTVTLDSPSPGENTFGQAVVNFQGAPDFSPTRIATPGPDGFPLAELPAGRGRRAGLQPVHPDRGLADRLQRADRRHRRRPLRRRPPHEHRRPRARRPHRRSLGSRSVRRVVGRPAVREGLRRRRADRLHLDRRRPAADRGARALDLRAGARQGGLQRRRRLPRLGPRAAVRLHQRPDRGRTTRSRRALST